MSKKIVTFEPGIRADRLAAILKQIDDVDADRRERWEVRPIVRGLPAGQLAVYASDRWRP